MAISPEIVVPIRWGFQPDGPISIRVTGPGVTPERKHADDAAFDLYCYLPDQMTGLWLHPGDQRNIANGVRLELPPGIAAYVKPRSSTIDKGLLVVEGLIDTGYRGEMFTRVMNVGSSPVVVEHGERLAQLVPFPNLAAFCVMERADELSESARGANGFGSTGR